MQKSELFNITNLIFELGQLRLETRRGWQRIGLRPENVAEHSLRAAQIAYILAIQEEYPNPHYVATLLVFHDMAETRTGDPDHVVKQYVKTDQEAAVRDQTAKLGETGKAIFRMWETVEQTETHAGKIAKDADRLEMAFTAKTLLAQGHKGAQQFIDSAGRSLRTDSAKQLFEALQDVAPDDWWWGVIGKSEAHAEA